MSDTKKKATVSRSRRNFLKAVAGGAALATVSMGASLEAFAAAHEKVDAERLKLGRQLDSDPFQIRESYQRYNSMDYAFNTVGRETGLPWFVAANRAAAEHVTSGMMSKGIRAPNVGMARVYAGVGAALWSPCIFLGRTGQGTENMGAQSWSDVGTIAGLRRQNRAPDITDPSPLTRYTKTVARLSGADLVGVAPFDIRWIYTHTQRNQYMPGDPELKEIRVEDAPAPHETDKALIIPADVQSVVTMVFSMNQVMLRTSPTPVAHAMAGMGYLRMAISAVAVAEFIRSQGYWAIPSTNCVGINVPIAIQAGLGEDGRHGMLVTPEFGSNVRTAKVFTNMPMIKDKPMSFGLKEFCNSCAKCANICPAQSLTFSSRRWDAVDESNNPGVFKFYHPYKKCLYFWMENGFTCGNCMAMCEGDVWVYSDRARDPQWLAANRPALDRYWNARAAAFGHGLMVNPNMLWDMPLEPYGLEQHSELTRYREEFKNRLRRHP